MSRMFHFAHRELQVLHCQHTLVHDVPDDHNPLDDEREVIDEPPPVLGSWPRVYAFALIELAVVIALFYAFTVAFRP